MVPKGSFCTAVDNLCYTQHVEDQRQLGHGTADTTVWKYAASQSLNILTGDTDFKSGGSANPNNGTWPGVIFYDDSASESRVLDALEAVNQRLDTNQIATLHETKQRPIYIPGHWA
jgi:predicted nuclease of predicted toxin-antitoxin system